MLAHGASKVMYILLYMPAIIIIVSNFHDIQASKKEFQKETENEKKNKQKEPAYKEETK